MYFILQIVYNIANISLPDMLLHPNWTRPGRASYSERHTVRLELSTLQFLGAYKEFH